MPTIALRTWVTDQSIWQVTLDWDDAGVLCDLVKLEAKCWLINSLAKEVAMPLELLERDLQGLRVWSERSTLADARSWLTVEQEELDSPRRWSTPRVQLAVQEGSAWMRSTLQ